jgi:hypothetical protein
VWVEIVLVLLLVQEEVAVLAVKGVLRLEAQIGRVGAQEVPRVVFQSLVPLVIALEVREVARGEGWAGALRVAELSCLVLLLD